MLYTKHLILSAVVRQQSKQTNTNHDTSHEQFNGNDSFLHLVSYKKLFCCKQFLREKVIIVDIV